jgi:DAACS family dicarboxylate/amino acid:cation (Na+ or H+) symporter
MHTRLLVALVCGIGLGAALHSWADVPYVQAVNAYLLRPIGQMFLRLILMVVVPMVFSALVIGVYELGRSHGLAGVVRRTLLFTVVLSTLSVAIGMTLVGLIRPGAAVPRQAAVAAGTGQVAAVEQSAAAARPVSEALVELIPRNPIDTAVRALDGEMLQLMIFAVVFGLALGAATPTSAGADNEAENVLVRVLRQIFDACMRIVEFVMRFAPVAVFAIVFNTAFTFGTGLFASLLLYVVTVVGGLLLQQFVVYPLMLRGVAGRSPAAFFKSCREVYLYAFSTASSNATLPLSLEVAERKLALPPHISRFVLTVGSTANQNGTALFEGVTVLFLAQAYGLDLGAGAQLRVLAMSILAGIGTAGVPGGSLPMVLLLAQSVGVPAEGMGLILGVDRFLDMCRTAVNVGGDLVIAALVSAAPGAKPAGPTPAAV